VCIDTLLRGKPFLIPRAGLERLWREHGPNRGTVSVPGRSVREFTRKGIDHSLEAFRPLLDGITNWPAALEVFEQTGYRGYLRFEYFLPYQHSQEASVYQPGDLMDRMLDGSDPAGVTTEVEERNRARSR
jgi:hypothetical protein